MVGYNGDEETSRWEEFRRKWRLDNDRNWHDPPRFDVEQIKIELLINRSNWLNVWSTDGIKYDELEK